MRIHIHILCFGLVAACVAARPATTFAVILPDLSAAGGGGQIDIKLINAERLVDKFKSGKNNADGTQSQGVAGTNNFLDVGDALRGILKITDIRQRGYLIWQDFAGNGAFSGGPADKTELTGIFDVTVISKKFVSGSAAHNQGSDIFSYIFKATGNLNINLSLGKAGLSSSEISNTALVLFAEQLESGLKDPDRLDPIPPTKGTIAQAELKATGGSLYAAFGGSSFNKNPTLADVYWTGLGSQNPASVGTTGVGQTMFGLNFLFNGTGFHFAQVNDPNEGLFNTTVDVYGQSKLKSQGVGPYNVRSDDPVVANVVLPEPMSLSIWAGMVVLGLAGAWRGTARQIAGRPRRETE